MNRKQAFHTQWPILKTYDGNHLRRIAMPLGGLGTGTISLGGRGDLRDWEIMHRPAKGYVPLPPKLSGQARNGPFFALYAKASNQRAVTRCLEGPLDTELYESSHGALPVNGGLPRFERATFAAAYPLGQVALRDRRVPLHVRLEAWNPMEPGDVATSALPVVLMRYVLHNPNKKSVDAAVCGSVPNPVGVDPGPPEIGFASTTAPRREGRGVNRWRQADGIFGVSMHGEDLGKRNPLDGTFTLATTAKRGVTHRTAWDDKAAWGVPMLDFWDDFSADGRLTPRDAGELSHQWGSVATRLRVPPGAERAVTFILAWHFPHRYEWGDEKNLGAYVGNAYTDRFDDAWDAAARVAQDLRRLERRTVGFVSALCTTNVPKAIKEAALFNASTLRTQTCFQTPDQRFYGWEGCGDSLGCCKGSCTHVWNYEQATAHLFGELSRSMREVEFGHTTDDVGVMSFRVGLPLLEQAQNEFKHAAADGQMGCLVKLYREWQLSGDETLLRKLWPEARRSLEFCWAKGGWDADRDGVMEGCQHNTMDVEYYGPNPQMTGWYLAAMRAAAAMARHLGDDDFANDCDRLFENGSQWMDDHLFNGDYYEHEIRLPGHDSAIHPSLRVGMGAESAVNPDYQLGAGCLVDQLVGQYMACVSNLGRLHRRAHVRKTLRSVIRFNRCRGMRSQFNNMRCYSLGDEAGLLMASYPRGDRPQRPFPYFNETMTGFEYVVAAHLIYEGMDDEAVRVVEDIRFRYDGHKRSPFNEAECGHHYARAMSSWACYLAWTGFHYSAVSGEMRFDRKLKGPVFWSTGDAWGVCQARRDGATITVYGGKVKINRLWIAGREVSFNHARTDPPALH